jgi:hypothetical protein
MIRVDLDTLLRGFPIEGELCELVGYGQIPVSVIKDVLTYDNPFITGILTKNRDIVGVHHHGRRPNAYQRSALDFLYPACARKGCPFRGNLQADHREDWAKTKFTLFEMLDMLCAHDHDLKTHHGWALVPGTGRRDFVPPDDPRHPRNAGNPQSAQGP